MNRRALLKGAGAAVVIAAVPLKLRAQESSFLSFDLDPVTVVGAEGLQSFDNIFSTSFSSMSLDAQWVALFGPNHPPPAHHPLAKKTQARIIAEELAKRAAAVGAEHITPSLVNVMVVPSPELVAPPVVTLPVPESYFFGADADEFRAHMQAQGLSEAESLTALVALQAALAPVEVASGYVFGTGLRLLLSGLAGALTTTAIAEIVGGTIVTFTAGAMIGIGIGALALIVYKVFPEVHQQIVLFGQTLFQYESQVEFLPPPVPVAPPVPFLGSTTPPASGQPWVYDPNGGPGALWWDSYWGQWIDATFYGGFSFN